MKKILEFIIVFLIGGTLYSIIEVLYRSYTHWTMFLAGGLIFYFLYKMFNYIGRGHLILKCLLGCVFITSVEYIAGAVLNLMLEMRVWDYSAKPLNLYGQICPANSVWWFFLSFPASILSFGIRKRLH